MFVMKCKDYWSFDEKGNIIEVDRMQGGGAGTNDQGCDVMVRGY